MRATPLERSTPALIGFAVLAALALLLAACSSGGDGAEEGSGGSTPAGESGDSQGDDADGPVGSGGVELTSILQLHLVHESDSGDGTSPWGDAEVHMLFEPGGELGVFVFDGENALGRHGTYDLTDGTLTVEVATPDMAFDASVELDLNGPEVEMPFQLFDDAAGTSVWRTEAMGPMGATDMVFQAIRYDDHERVAREDAVERAHDFAAARVESDAGMETDGLDIGLPDTLADCAAAVPRLARLSARPLPAVGTMVDRADAVLRKRRRDWSIRVMVEILDESFWLAAPGAGLRPAQPRGFNGTWGGPAFRCGRRYFWARNSGDAIVR